MKPNRTDPDIIQQTQTEHTQDHPQVPRISTATDTAMGRNSNASLFISSPVQQIHNSPKSMQQLKQELGKEEDVSLLSQQRCPLTHPIPPVMAPASLFFGPPSALGAWPAEQTTLPSAGPSFLRGTQATHGTLPTPTMVPTEVPVASGKDLQNEVKELSQVILKLQDLILSEALRDPFVAHRDIIISRLSAIMKESPVAQRLDISSSQKSAEPQFGADLELDIPKTQETVLTDDEEEKEEETLVAQEGPTLPSAISPNLFPTPTYPAPWVGAPPASAPTMAATSPKMRPPPPLTAPAFFPTGWPVATTGVPSEITSPRKYTPLMNVPPLPTTPSETLSHSVPSGAVKKQLSPRKMETIPSGHEEISGANVEELRGQLLSLTRHQAGCRFLQRQLSAANEERGVEIVGYVLEEIGNQLLSVVMDNCGQYLVPKLVEHASVDQRSQIVRQLCPYVFRAAVDPCGSHAMQRILPYLNDAQAAELANCIAMHLVELCKDNKGNYLVQAFLKCFGPGPRVQLFVDALNANLVPLANHKVGCTVITRCLEFCDAGQMNQFMDNIQHNIQQLVVDQYGNYVVQHILLHSSPEYALRLTRSLFGKIGFLCQQKFGSNVIEKCLEAADASTFERLMSEMTKPDILVRLIADPYGNFVVQKLLDLANPEQHAHLVSLLVPLLGQAKGSPYTIHIQKKLLRV